MSRPAPGNRIGHDREDNDPVDTFCEFLEQIWSDNDDETAFAIWKLKVTQNTRYAPATLEMLDGIIANPPEGLANIMRTCGWINLTHPAPDSDSPPVRYSDWEYLEWLKETTRRLKDIYNEHRPPPATERRF